MSYYVAVVGPGEGASEEVSELAFKVGRTLAERGAVVVNGGLNGVMGAASAGAREAGGQVVGLLGGEDRSAANDHLTVALTTGLGEVRNALVVRCADGVIGVGCSWGTLSEIALATRMHTPTVCMRGWTILDENGEALPLDCADDPEEAVEKLFAKLASPRDRG